MRVTTDLWVSALIRRVFGGGGFAAVMRKGAAESGAVFVLTRDRLGTVELFGPAPQTSYDQARPDERLFVRLGDGEDQDALQARLERERKFDSDIWVVEIEAGAVPVEELLSVSLP
ncbi:DUF1491 family protein [Mesorhizobium sp. 8]|uniref:DUF1491 family protein n=1 Tax=Mesorhizobium sp. 8 TaxID=2584466 RepID=UPI00112105D8|nr:DUF1491 family protein [Mesorhizobium sp. 8]QDC03007.1 DUF1491 family protein [Mesorhizobium sp. 8]